MYKRGRYSVFVKHKICVKEEDKATHHPLLILDWGYPPQRKGNCQSIVIIKALQAAQAWKPAQIMAQNSNIISSWTMKEFFMQNRGLKRVPCVNSQTGENFCLLAFGSAGSQTFVSFGKNLGQLTDSQLNAQKEHLQVVEVSLTPEQVADRKAKGLQTRQFILCRQGENTWQDVNLDW